MDPIKHKVKKIAIPIYFGWLFVVFSKDFNYTIKELNIPSNAPDANVFGAFAQSGYVNDISHYWIVMPFDVNHDLIAHEIVHLVNFIYLHANIQLDRANDEPQAYLAAWVTKQVYKAKRKLKA